MMFLKKSYVFPVTLSLLTGCSCYEVEFDCPAGKGLTCASLSEVNHQIDLGVLGGEEEGTPLEVSFKRGPSCSVGESCSQALSLTRSDVLFYHPPQRLSSGEVLPGRYVRVRGEP